MVHATYLEIKFVVIFVYSRHVKTKCIENYEDSANIHNSQETCNNNHTPNQEYNYNKINV